MITKPVLPAERPGRPAPEDLRQIRASLAAGTAAGAFACDPAGIEEFPGGVRALRFRAPGLPRGTVLHIHGGGFRMGTPEMGARFASALATRAGVDVVSIDYRLAPEHPFPGGLGDCLAAYHALAVSERGPLVVSGDSAGGNLAMVIVGQTLCGARAPAGLILLSAWVDLALTDCYEANAATDPLFGRPQAEAAREMYLQGLSPADPLVSPIHADIAGFPPTLISVGEGEVLCDELVSLAARMAEAGVPVTRSVIPGMEHTAVTRDPALTGSAETFELVLGFLRDILGQD